MLLSTLERVIGGAPDVKGISDCSGTTMHSAIQIKTNDGTLQSLGEGFGPTGWVRWDPHSAFSVGCVRV